MTYANDPINPIENPMSGPVLGLTKREYFAALAMQGMISASTHGFSFSVLASESVSMADALIAELNKTEK